MASDFAGKEVRKLGYNLITERDGRHKKMLLDFDLLLPSDMSVRFL